MNRFAIGIVVATILLLAQGCSFLPRAEENSATAAKMQQDDSMDDMDHSGHAMSDTGDGEDLAIAQPKLTAPRNITPNTPVSLVIDIQDESGKEIKSFDTFQEKLMHLIVVSDNLQVFSHLHPTYKENGRFEVSARFPQPGSYTLFRDYQPTGQTEQVSVLKTQVTGNSLAAPAIDR